jgi:hypothetical protein
MESTQEAQSNREPTEATALNGGSLLRIASIGHVLTINITTKPYLAKYSGNSTQARFLCAKMKMFLSKIRHIYHKLIK